MTELLDPTSERAPLARPRIARPQSLGGRTVALLDIAKKRGDVFLERIAELLESRGVRVKRYRKQRFSIVAPPELLRQIRAECDLAVEALAD